MGKHEKRKKKKKSVKIKMGKTENKINININININKNINRIIKTLAAVIVLGFALCACSQGSTESKQEETQKIQEISKQGNVSMEDTISETAEGLVSDNPSPSLSSVGGDWLVMGVKLSGIEAPEKYFDYYYDNIRVEVKRNKGVLSEDRYTEYARLIIVLSSIGKDFTDIEGYDMRPYLDDREKVEAQGPSAAAFALIAANKGKFALENEEDYIEFILEESPEAMMGDIVLTDYISMGAEALSYYAERDDVKEYLENAVEILMNEQKDSGAMNNCESTAECIIALTQMGIDPKADERFIKDGNTLYDGLMSFYLGNGKFMHDEDSNSADAMAAEHALLAMDAIKLSGEGKTIY